LAVMIRKIISIVNSFKLCMSFQLSSTHQRLFFLHMLNILRLRSDMMRSSLKGINFVRCQACNFSKLTLSLMEQNKLFTVLYLFICSLIAEI
jgi:hypothetical protein